MKSHARQIQVHADWSELTKPHFMGTLRVTPARGKEIFSFEYNAAWLKGEYRYMLDPALRLHAGPQYASHEMPNFGIFLDSSPDRWGRTLMRRREAYLARSENRTERNLLESDFLLGVYDENRMGAVRFKVTPDGPFLDNNLAMAAPPWARLRELEAASLSLEEEDAESDARFSHWLSLLVVPGSSLGGARPKASVVDEKGSLWIAKFPSRKDELDVGAWEWVVHQLAGKCGIQTPTATVEKFGHTQHVFLAQRFDRTTHRARIHFASAMTLLQRKDGDSSDNGASYLEIARFIIQESAQPREDLEQLWRRILFSMMVSNTDDHLRNHGFLLRPKGWCLSPAYDMNPEPLGMGLSLNVSETDNSLSLELAMEVAPLFRIESKTAKAVASDMKKIVKRWRTVADSVGLKKREQDRMSNAFRLAE